MNNNIISFFLNLDPSVYILFLGGAVGVTLLTQWAKRLFNLTNEKHVVAVFNLIALATTGLQYFLSSSHLPPYILGINTLVLTGIAQPLYIYAIKHLSIFISNVQAYKNQVLAKVDTIAAAEPLPADIIPPSTTTTTTTVTVPPAPVIPEAAPAVAPSVFSEPAVVPVVKTPPVASF